MVLAWNKIQMLKLNQMCTIYDCYHLCVCNIHVLMIIIEYIDRNNLDRIGNMRFNIRHLQKVFILDEDSHTGFCPAMLNPVDHASNNILRALNAVYGIQIVVI